jgi:aldose 1-epimerase
MRLSVILLGCALAMQAAPPYTAERTTDHGVEVVHLKDQAHNAEVSVVPSVGNRAYEFKVNGKNILYFPLPDPGALKNSSDPALNAIPFLAPWANRVRGGGFWANGKRYLFNPDLGTLRMDAKGLTIHGLLTASPLWEIVDVKADAQSARVTSRLQFWRYPDLMANWPFAQEYEMTYILSAGVLEVSTTVSNLSSQPMPISIGFHPYFNIPDVPRDEYMVSLPARRHVETDAQLVATGETVPNQLTSPISLKDHTFDDGFTDLVRDANGRATFAASVGPKKIEVIYGPKYQVAVVYAPPGRNYICFEPMTGITNAINLAHEGKYPELQTLAPGLKWQESFWVHPSGF